MKKLILSMLIAVFFISCSSAEKAGSLEQKYNITKQSAKEWDKTIINVVVGEALIEDWYGEENPILYLRKTGKMSEKDAGIVGKRLANSALIIAVCWGLSALIMAIAYFLK